MYDKMFIMVPMIGLCILVGIICWIIHLATAVKLNNKIRIKYIMEDFPRSVECQFADSSAIVMILYNIYNELCNNTISDSRLINIYRLVGICYPKQYSLHDFEKIFIKINSVYDSNVIHASQLKLTKSDDTGIPNFNISTNNMSLLYLNDIETIFKITFLHHRDLFVDPMYQVNIFKDVLTISSIGFMMIFKYYPDFSKVVYNIPTHVKEAYNI